MRLLLLSVWLAMPMLALGATDLDYLVLLLVDLVGLEGTLVVVMIVDGYQGLIFRNRKEAGNREVLVGVGRR